MQYLTSIFVLFCGLLILFHNSFFYILIIVYLFFTPKIFYYFSSLDIFIYEVKRLFYFSLPVSYLKSFLSFVFLFILIINFVGNVPIRLTPSLYYLFTFSLRFRIWLSLFISSIKVNTTAFLSHLLPFGAPLSLSLVLPLIEGLSQILRPLTLCVRLRTNLSAGHIMLFIFSYFTTLMAASSSLFMGICLVILIILEGFISLLQAYIFVTLLSLYFLEVEEML
jgi:ATP synthase subunit 6